MAIIGIIAAAISVAINPGKRMAQARDAQRRRDIGFISNELIAYYTQNGAYPFETICEGSIGVDPFPPCSTYIQTDWIQATNIWLALVTNGSLKKLPVDPKNNYPNYYRYEPKASAGDNCGAGTCEYYWVGVQLEAPADPNKPIYRCSDDPSLPDGSGCKEVNTDFTAAQPTN